MKEDIIKFETFISTINKNDLIQGNLSAFDNIMAKKGYKPYIKQGYNLEPLSLDKINSYKNIFWLLPEKVEVLNKLGSEIEVLTNQYNDFFSEHTLSR